MPSTLEELQQLLECDFRAFAAIKEKGRGFVVGMEREMAVQNASLESLLETTELERHLSTLKAASLFRAIDVLVRRG